MSEDESEKYVENEDSQHSLDLDEWIEPETTTDKIQHNLINDKDIDDYEEEKNMNKLR